MRIYILLGGLFGPDGWLTSAGMLRLDHQLKPYGDVKTYTWDQYQSIYPDLLGSQPAGEPKVIIGYSGGGSRATWFANEHPHQVINLMVLYDPSPSWQMKNLVGTGVKRCLQYYNTTPSFFGLGGGRTFGPQVETISIAENHILIQTDQKLHARTIQAIKEIT